MPTIISTPAPTALLLQEKKYQLIDQIEPLLAKLPHHLTTRFQGRLQELESSPTVPETLSDLRALYAQVAEARTRSLMQGHPARPPSRSIYLAPKGH